MANLLDTIVSFSSVTKLEELKGNTLCFITTNGVVLGKPINVEPHESDVKTNEDLIKLLYGESIKFTKEINDENELKRNLEETILLEDVKYKVGKTTLNMKHFVLNTSQIVGVFLTSTDQVEDFLNSLQL